MAQRYAVGWGYEDTEWSEDELHSGEVFACGCNDSKSAQEMVQAGKCCGDWGGQICWNQESNGLAWLIGDAKRVLDVGGFFTRPDGLDDPLTAEDLKRLHVRGGYESWTFRHLRREPIITPRMVMVTLLRDALEDIEFQPGRCGREWDKAYPGKDTWPTCRKCGADLDID